MQKFTTKQLQAALIELRAKNTQEANAAFRMTYDELNVRMGDDAFDAWTDSLGW
jgi:hypothetical protein